MRRFDPFVLRSLGQESSSWNGRAAAAVARYDALLDRANRLPDDEKASVLAYSGDGTMPGTPADRYRFVNDAIFSDGPWDQLHQSYVRDLEDIDAHIEEAVGNAENSAKSGSIALATPEGRLTGSGWALLGLSAIGLFVVPFLFD